jgi:hypothetical protein
MDENFLLENRFAEELYHGFAEPLPIIDYHGHLSPRDIAEDQRFENLTQIWLAGDHYKWRTMRAAGVNERFITGDAPDRDKFLKWIVEPGFAGPLRRHADRFAELLVFPAPRIFPPDPLRHSGGRFGEGLPAAGHRSNRRIGPGRLLF